MEIGKSYWIDPNGILHKVPNTQHHEFAQQYVSSNHSHLIELWNKYNEPVRPWNNSDVCKDLLVGELKWITFTPLGWNTHVGDTGRNVNGHIKKAKFTKKQLDALIQLWEINLNPVEKLEKILQENNILW